MTRTGRPPVERVTVPCASCGTSLTRRASDMARLKTGRVFCEKCAATGNKKPRKGTQHTCLECGVTFYARPGAVARFCSQNCHWANQRHNRVTLTCVTCGKRFSLGKAAAADRGPAPTCSRACDTLRRTTNAVGRFHNGRPVLRWSTGYLFVYEPDHPAAYRNGWLAEHRWLMEQQLGRQLTPHEHVHHVNGVKDDNRLENLVVLGHGEHSRLTAAEREARLASDRAELEEYRRRYGPLQKE